MRNRQDIKPTNESRNRTAAAITAMMMSAIVASAMIRLGGEHSIPVTVVEQQDDKTAKTTTPQDNKQEDNRQTRQARQRKTALERYRERQAKLKLEEDTIPDSLLHPRWPIQKTTPITYDDLKQGPADLKRPDNLKQEAEYNDTLDRYVLGTRMGQTWMAAPIMMTPTEYQKWTERSVMRSFFRQKNAEIYEKKGKEAFDFTDMHFDLGPAEKIFGPGGIRVKTQGTAEIKLGATMKNIDNPSLPIRNRKTTTIDFDEKININVTGKVGDKMNLNLGYNTDATFDYDAQNMKLKYDGKEDEIIKLVEAGNVSFPSNSSLIQGASSLFGLRTDMQFGKLKLQTVFSQKKSSSKSVSSKGGTQLTPFELNVTNYEENRHFFLAGFFRKHYNEWMSKLPTVASGVTINRIEVWVTNKSGTTSNTRDIVAVANLGEDPVYAPGNVGANTDDMASVVPSNQAGTLYSEFKTARDNDVLKDAVSVGNYTNSIDFEKIGKARLLSSSEYSVNTLLGTISLNSSLQTDQVVAVAYEYTYGGMTYQVGEFSADKAEVDKQLIVKSLKNVNNSPEQPTWRYMMRNVYHLASSVQKEKFKLDIKYKGDSTGVYNNYIPEQQVKSTPIIKLIGADRLDNNNRSNSNGYFDYVDGYTVKNGRVYMPTVEPFGRDLYERLTSSSVPASVASRYNFYELYDSTRTVARQKAEKNRYVMTGQYKGSSANVISLGAYNVPQGSVVVTAGGVTLTEGSDYSVDYSAGEVTILNQSIIDAGTSVNVSLESNSDYSLTRKTMLGLNWEYDFSKFFQISGTFQHLSEQSPISKVAIGSEPVSNTLVGFNLNWKRESQWLTNMLDKIPLLNVKQPSNIQFSAEFAKLFAGTAGGTQDNASYIDDFESSTSNISLLTPTSWSLASVPSTIVSNPNLTDLSAGDNRARLAWYTIDPLFTNMSSSLTPAHIRDDRDQLSDHRVRQVYVSELYPNRDQSTYSGATSTLSLMNMAFYPEERGPYNFTTNLNADGHLPLPQQSWGGMMRSLNTTDFEEANIEYVEFWMMDPYAAYPDAADRLKREGKLVINLGEVSEDILPDGKMAYESGLPVNDSQTTDYTSWGRIPVQNTITYAFDNSSNARARQDLGLNGLNDEEEASHYTTFMDAARSSVSNAEALQQIENDPAADDYQYFRGSTLDQNRVSILDRYKYINNPQGNSPDSDNRTENYDTSYKSMPDVEDINQDYTLNQNESYWEYTIDISESALQNASAQGSNNFIVDKRVTQPRLRNDETPEVTWYLFRVPVKRGVKRGNIQDFSSIRFMRMYMTGFEEPIVIRLASLDLVRGDWRIYDQNIQGSTGNATDSFSASIINYEENSDKKPVNYVLPPGISRVVDPSQPQLTENNEQAMRLDLDKVGAGEAVAIYKNTNYDMRYFKRMQMFVHANALESDSVNLKSGQLALFMRMGSDYNNNYYEYEIPLTLTPAGTYSNNNDGGRRTVWPEENMLDIDLKKFTALKKDRNAKKALGQASLTQVHSIYDPDNQKNKISVVGNPSLGEVHTMMIGVKNLSSETKSGEVWINELRLLEPESEGGWAATANLNVQLSDLGSVSASGKYMSDGYGGLEQTVTQRSLDNYGTYSVTTSLELGKFFPEKAKVTIPLYYSVSRERTSPKYNPLDTDMKLDDALEAATQHERDSIKSIAVTNTVNKNFALSGVRVGISTKGHPMPYDPANFSFSYSHSHRHTDGETTVYENEDQWRGSMTYSWTPVYKSYTPFKKAIKSKSKYFNILKDFTFNYLPQNISANSEISRYYYEMQERDLEDLGSTSNIQATWNSQFLWNREFSIRWDLTKNLRMSFQSATRAEVEEPYAQINKDLYPEQYQAWKDSVWTSIKHMGTPLDYNQTFNASYQLPLNQIPIFSWLTANGTYNATYQWARGTVNEDETNYGNTINMRRTVNVNSTLDMVKLYNLVPFLKKVNDKFNRTPARPAANNKKKQTAKASEDDKNLTDEQRKAAEAEKKKKQEELKTKEQESKLKKRTFAKEITLAPDTSLVVNHGKRTKRLVVTAKTADGKTVKVKYKKLDDNKIKVFSNSDTTQTLKLNVLALEPLDDQKWYKIAQTVARTAMMVRNINVSYRNNYSMALPGFMPNAGDMFGQRSDGGLQPGLDFAFGFVDDSFIDRAGENGWLNSYNGAGMDDESTISISPASTSRTNDLQVRMTLEPIRNLKIDLNMAHTRTTNRSIRFMYSGTPATESGSFSMTTISIGSAFEGIGNADNGYHSNAFEKFCNLLPQYRDRVQAQYANHGYTPTTVTSDMDDAAREMAEASQFSQYSSDVMIPAFLEAYTSGSSLDIFPALKRMLPNWSVRFSGLTQIPWVREHFKSVNINHSYKSIFAIGSYSSYSTYHQLNGDMIGTITNASGYETPHSMFNVSTVSINEAFSPLLGIDFTLPNNMTFKAEYRTTRTTSLSMTSVQINENLSKDWVFGMGYKIADFQFWGSKARRARNKSRSGSNSTQNGATKKVTSKSNGFAHDLNLRLDVSLRSQAAITRDIATVTSQATSGNDAFKLAFSADYSLSKMLTMSFYYDRQSNNPLLSSGAYPTVTQDFGLSMKFSLTR